MSKPWATHAAGTSPYVSTSLRAKRPFSACSASFAGLGVRRSALREGGSNPAFFVAAKEAGLLRRVAPRNDEPGSPIPESTATAVGSIAQGQPR